jgi:hypothetical protein
MRLGSILGAACIAIAVIGFLVHHLMTSRERERWGSEISEAVQKQKWEEASQLLDRLGQMDSSMRSRPEFEALALQARRGKEEEADRVLRFQTLVQRLNSAGAATPDAQALARLKDLARTDDEKLAYEQIRSRAQQVLREKQQVKDRAFTETLDGIRKQFATVMAVPDGPSIESRGSVESIRKELTVLVKSQDISPMLMASAETLMASVNSVISGLDTAAQRVENQRARLDAIKAANKNPKRLALLLNEFVKQSPEHELSSGFTAAASRVEGWITTEPWPSTFNLSEGVRVNDRTRAQELTENIDSILTKQSKSIYRPALVRYRDYLKRALDSLDPANSPKQANGDLNRTLSHPLVSNIYVLTSKKGEVFYTTSVREPPRLGTRVAIRYIDSAESAFQAGRLAESLRSPAEFDDLVPKPAGQALFATSAKAVLDDAKQTWETLHLEMCRLLMAQAKIDPILRCAIASDLTRLSSLRDWTEFPEIAAWRQRLAQVNTAAPWMDPANTSVAADRLKAEEAIKQAPDFAKLSAVLAVWEAKMRMDLAIREPVGLLWRDQNNTTIFLPSQAELDDGELETVTSDGAGLRFEPIATVKDRQVQLLGHAGKLPAGTLVLRAQR